MDEDKAAVVLQSHLKGMMTRKKMKEKKKATTRYSNFRKHNQRDAQLKIKTLI